MPRIRVGSCAPKCAAPSTESRSRSPCRTARSAPYDCFRRSLGQPLASSISLRSRLALSTMVSKEEKPVSVISWLPSIPERPTGSGPLFRTAGLLGSMAAALVALGDLDVTALGDLRLADGDREHTQRG